MLKLFNPAAAWTAILGFTITSLVIFLGAPSLLNITFPATAALVGAYLYFKYSFLYIGFNWWVWFLAPLVRRLADYNSSYTEPSPIILAPYLVTLISGYTLFKRISKPQDEVEIYFSLSAIGIIYALLIGFIKSSYTSVVTSCLEWVCPLIFGFYLYSEWQNYPDLEKNTKRIFLWCALLVGVYGMIQYLVAPEWDRVWLERNILISESARAFGDPEPLRIRVWSTMNGPGVFAQVMMAALLLLPSNMSFLNLPATAFGYLSFLLSLVRSAWVGWLIGIATLFTTLKSNLQIRLILIMVIGSMCVVPLIFLDPFSDFITERIQTFTSGSEDGSAEARLGHYNRLLGVALTNFLGDGFGYNHGLLDSAVLDILLTLGWVGSAFYMGGMTLILLRLLVDPYIKRDAFASSARAISVGMIIQMLFGSVMLGLPGQILWGFLGLGMAAQKYRDHRLKVQKFRIPHAASKKAETV